MLLKGLAEFESGVVGRDVEHPAGDEAVGHQLECARLDETRGGGLLKFVFYNGTVLPFASSELTFYKPAEENIDWALDSVSFGCAEPDVRVAFVDMLAIEFCDTPEEAVRSGENFCFVAYTDSEYTLYRLVFTGLPMLS